MLGHDESILHVNYRYVLDFIEKESTLTPNIKILDYGCGNGEIVEAGLEQGLEIYGVDIYTSSDAERIVAGKGLLGNRILKIKDNKVDFSDGFFDLIVSNQVFEHVENIDAVLNEIFRILKPGGVFLTLFPSKDVWREGHCGIPFLHWFPKGSIIRYQYAFLLHSLGVGKNKSNLPRKEWVDYVILWLDQYCFYRSRNNIKRLFNQYFQLKFIEDDHILFRMKASKLNYLDSLVRFPLTKPFAKEMFRKLGGLVILATKPLLVHS